MMLLDLSRHTVRRNIAPYLGSFVALFLGIKAAVLAQLGGRWVDPDVLDAVVRRVMAEVGR